MLICVTQRKLCQENFLYRIQQLAQAKPYAVLLREKDLDLPSYERLAWKVKEICDRYGVLLILHQNSTVAEKMKLTHLQLSLPALRAYQKGGHSLLVGASVHSVAEAEEAQALGAAYIVAGHIYATDCKKEIPPRGLSFLRQVCQAVSLPVFAIGGIASNNVKEILESGAKGCCTMSEAMTCQEPAALVHEFATAFLPVVCNHSG
ncbi:thiamine phosphate synthase [Sporomusa sp. KB1]|jgi:thiamine-phosphate pyrophosphorylase|uniref:thiamine phosphate synthase n=1 Tax=Sporomusa sp. KB1 TaxID=943346 RepID=UPI0011A8A514|nr:thiamine phosphate synthase [Sporomusa sp. KB1]TWH45724.1 thiamine-phosphate pyrophosphorylase [Sporomusa sp. KB1]